jgi:hypothetical protein
MSAMPKRDIEDFISRWTGATASEQSISQQFLLELCELLDVPQILKTLEILGRARRAGDGKFRV